MTLRELVLSDIHVDWRKVAAAPDNDKVMGTPPDDFTILEHSQADVAKGNCLGSGVVVEALDRKMSRIAPASMALAEQRSYRGAYWPHAYARFFVSADSSVAVLDVVFGPRYGRGYRYEKAYHPSGKYRYVDGVLGSFKRAALWIS